MPRNNILTDADLPSAADAAAQAAELAAMRARMQCRSCRRPLFLWETSLNLCRNCAIADVEPAAYLPRRAGDGVVLLMSRPIDRMRQLISGPMQLGPTRKRMVRQFIVERKDGTRETVELNVPKVNPHTRQAEGREDRTFIVQP